MKSSHVIGATALLTLLLSANQASSEGNSARGERVFGACAACHSLQANQNMTGQVSRACGTEKPGVWRVSRVIRLPSNHQTSFGTIKRWMTGSLVHSI